MMMSIARSWQSAPGQKSATIRTTNAMIEMDDSDVV